MNIKGCQVLHRKVKINCVIFQKVQKLMDSCHKKLIIIASRYQMLVGKLLVIIRCIGFQ